MAGFGAVFLVATVLVFEPSLNAPFIFDDFHLPFANPHAAQMSPVFWVGGVRPLLMATYWANFLLAGSATFYYHLTNIVLHVLASVLAFGVLRRLLKLSNPHAGSPLLSLVGAAIFLLHPLQTESVDYLSGRSEVLCGLFVLGSWLIFLNHFNEWTMLLTAAKVVAVAGAAILSKESGICVAGLLIATDIYWKEGSIGTQLRKRWILYGPLAVGALAVSVIILRGLSNSTTAGFSAGWTPGSYALTESKAILLYLRLFLLPVGQNADWRLPVIDGVARALPYLAGVAFFVAAIVWLYHRARLVSFGLLVFLIALAPTSSFIPVADALAERRMYVPILGLVIAVLGALPAVRRTVSVSVAVTAIIALLSALGIASWHRSQVWSSDVSLWRDAIAKSPRNSRAHASLGGAYMLQRNCAAAAPEYELAVVYGGLDEVNGRNLGAAYECSGQADKALAAYRELVATHPIADAWTRIGYLEGLHEHATAAMAAFDTAIRLDQRNVNAWAFRGTARIALNDLTGARDDFHHALALDPANLIATQWMEKLSKVR
jgi:tetratricopeptide (TPR) repeat protein